MDHAETVTFGGSGLDRAAHRRGDAHARADAGEGRVVVLWRGKPLVDDAGLVRLAHDAPVLAEAAGALLYLGEEEDGPVFARDVSGWEPEGDHDTLGNFFDPSEQRHPGQPEEQRFAELRGVMTRLSARDAELAATARAIFGWHRSHRFCAVCGQQSAPAMGGWQRDCASCGAHHFPRTDPVVIMLILRGNSVLLGRSPGWPEGMYSLLAGFVEPGETIEAAVRRETFEEAGVRVGRVGYLASQPWAFPSSLMFGCRGEAESTEITLDPAELEDAIWVSREEMVDVMAGTHAAIRQPRHGAIAHFLLANWLADTLD